MIDHRNDMPGSSDRAWMPPLRLAQHAASYLPDGVTLESATMAQVGQAIEDRVNDMRLAGRSAAAAERLATPQEVTSFLVAADDVPGVTVRHDYDYWRQQFPHIGEQAQDGIAAYDGCVADGGCQPTANGPHIAQHVCRRFPYHQGCRYPQDDLTAYDAEHND